MLEELQNSEMFSNGPVVVKPKKVYSQGILGVKMPSSISFISYFSQIVGNSVFVHLVIMASYD